MSSHLHVASSHLHVAIYASTAKDRGVISLHVAFDSPHALNVAIDNLRIAAAALAQVQEAEGEVRVNNVSLSFERCL